MDNASVALVAAGVTFLCWVGDLGYRIKTAKDKSRTEQSLAAQFHGKHKYRTFSAIRQQIAGYPDDELRRLLLSVGAISVRRRSTGEEMWVMREVHEQPIDIE
jgi:hypothetical protein